MDFIKQQITEWLKEILVGGIMNNLSGMFDNVNSQVGQIASQVGTTPQAWNTGIYNMIRTLSENVMMPIAGLILAFVMTLELIQIITDKNNFHDIETAVFFKWIFKTACAILIVTNTWNIVMGIFDVAQSVVNSAAGIIVSDTSIDISSVTANLQTRLMAMDLGPLFGLWFQSIFVGFTMWALTICIFIIVYGRMIEIYLPGLLSLSFSGASGEAILHRMDLMGISISTGSACNSANTEISHVLKAIRLEEKPAKGTVRISLGRNNTEENVESIVGALTKILR